MQVVKVGSVMSGPRPVLGGGGCPTAIPSGFFLFNLSIDDFEAYSNDVHDYSPGDYQALTAHAPDPAVGFPAPLEPTERDSPHRVPVRTEALQYIDDNVINEKLN